MKQYIIKPVALDLACYEFAIFNPSGNQEASRSFVPKGLQ